MNNDKRTKMMMTLIAIGCIIVVILISSLVIVHKSRSKQSSEDLQQEIMDYADSQNSNSIVEEETDEKNDNNNETESSKTESNTKIEENSEATANPSKAGNDYSNIKYDTQEQLKEMMSYWADNNQSALDDLSSLDRYKAMSAGIKDGESSYYGDTDLSGAPNGTGIAVYSDNAYYYGEFLNGKRSGEGTWLHYHYSTINNANEIYSSPLGKSLLQEPV